MADTIIGDIEELLNAPKAPWIVVLEAIVLRALPAVLEQLAGGETPIEIAANYAGNLWAFGDRALVDLAAGKTAAQVLADLDSTAADMIENIRCGNAPAAGTPPGGGPSILERAAAGRS